MADTLFDKKTVKKIEEILSKMKKKVYVVLLRENNDSYSDTALKMLEELSAINEKLKYKIIYKDSEESEKYNVEAFPAFVLEDENEKSFGVYYYGIPAGLEFGNFLNEVMNFSTGPEANLSEASLDKLKSIDKPIDIKVFITPTCPHCPKAVMVGHNIALANENIRTTMIEANYFSDLSRKYNVSSVPQVVINENIIFVGALPEEEYVKRVLEAL